MKILKIIIQNLFKQDDVFTDFKRNYCKYSKYYNEYSQYKKY